MKLTDFELSNCRYAEEQNEYLTLPAHKISGCKYGTVITCWKGNWKERIKFIFTGRIWLSILTFNKPLQPQKIDIDIPIENEGSDSKNRIV